MVFDSMACRLGSSAWLCRPGLVHFALPYSWNHMLGLLPNRASARSIRQTTKPMKGKSRNSLSAVHGSLLVPVSRNSVENCNPEQAILQNPACGLRLSLELSSVP